MVGYNNTIKNNIEKELRNKKYNYFVETGTFKGDTIQQIKNLFLHIKTIELNKDLFLIAKKRFEDSNNIELFNGDSVDMLNKIILNIDEDSIFFLDAHYAGPLSSKTNLETPLKEELKILLNRKEEFNDLIIIDDVSWLGKKGKIEFKSEWNSKFFPDGGIFEYDWTYFSKNDIYEMFEGKKIVEKDDRIFIYT